MDCINILIVDDHPMMREALMTAIEDEPGLKVIGMAANGNEALQMVEKIAPEIVLVDLLMPEMNGLELIAALQSRYPEVKSMVVSSLEDEEKILQAIQAGALGYFPKTASRQYLLEAIRKVAAGIPYMPAEVSAKLFKSLREMKSSPGSDEIANKLTSRQQEILALLGEGRSDQEIAKLLHLTNATVRSHIFHIIQRLDLENRSQAIAYANRHFNLTCVSSQ